MAKPTASDETISKAEEVSNKEPVVTGSTTEETTTKVDEAPAAAAEKDTAAVETPTQETPTPTATSVKVNVTTAAPVAQEENVVIAKPEDAAPIVSGNLAPSTSADVGEVTTTSPSMSSDLYAGSVLFGLGAETFSQEAQELFLEIITSGSSVAKGTLADVLHYVKVMGPLCPQNAQSGSANQIALYTSLVNCINNAGSDFQLMWAIILRVVFETKDTGAFNERFCFRFFPDMALEQSARTAFRNLLSIMTSTAGASGRATALSQIDFQKALGKQFTDSGKSRLLAFYNV